jgi:hypothetical protein
METVDHVIDIQLKRKDIQKFSLTNLHVIISINKINPDKNGFKNK